MEYNIMKKTIQDKITDYLNLQFREKCPERAKDKFGDLGFKTEYNFLSNCIVTHWKKKQSKKEAEKIVEFISAYEKGFTDAMNLVYWYNREN